MVRSKISKVLVYRLGSLGDTVVVLPALHLVERAFPNAERMLLTNFPIASKAAAMQQVLDNSGLIHRYQSYPLGLRDARAVARLVKELRAWRPGVLVYLAAARSGLAVWRDALFFAFCGVREMIGLPVTRRMRNPLPMPGGLFEHEARRLARCVAKLGDARLDHSASWDLHLREGEIASARDVLDLWPGRKRFIVATPGTKVQAKDWGAANWERSLKRISSHYPDLGLALIGSADEYEDAEIVASGWRGPKINLCGRLSPRQSAAIIREAIMYAGHDTGPMHLAAAAQVPCVAVFSARIPPGVWFPWGDGHKVIYHRVPCAGCKLDICVANAKRCMTSISPDEVYDAAVDILDRRLAAIEAWRRPARLNSG